MHIPQRRMTPDEISAWIVNYHATGGINAFELEVVRLVNIERANYGLNPLTINPTLMIAARFKSQAMHDMDYFAHTNPVYGRFVYISRELFNFPIITMGENIGRFHRSPEHLVQNLMTSPGHRANILDVAWTEMGAGFYNQHWTQKFSMTSGIVNDPAPSR